MDHSKPHSRRSKSSSVLPIHPEPDLNHRRSGIRHFTQVPSTRRKDQKQRRLCNFGKSRSKLRSAMGPMQWRDFINKNASEQSPEYGDLPQTLEGVENATAREQLAINELKSMQRCRDPVRMMRRVPVHGKGFMLVPQPVGAHEQAALRPEYACPYDIPDAATVQPPHLSHASLTTTPVGYFPAVTITLEKATHVACGISIAVGILFVWIYRYEVMKYGGIFGAVFLVWKLAQWYTQISLYKREQELIQEGRLVPAQSTSQHCIIHQMPPSSQMCQQAVIVPGGWVA